MRTIDLLLIFLSTGSMLAADLEDHLKKVEEKSGMQTIQNVDFIYMINLDERPEKFELSLVQLEPYGITPARFSAVNGWKLSLETLNEVGLKFSPEMQGGFMGTCYLPNGNYEPSHEIIERFGRTYFCHCLSRGAIGIALSHISILQDAWESGYETIWVMEDDIDLLQDPNTLSDLIDKLDALVGKEGWDILFTDKDIRDQNGHHKTTYWAGRRPDFFLFSLANDYAMKREVSPDFYQIGARSGAHSMILRRSGIQKLLQFFQAHQIFFPYDMEYILPPGIKLFTVKQDIVSNLPKAPSDNGGPNYLTRKPFVPNKKRDTQVGGPGEHCVSLSGPPAGPLGLQSAATNRMLVEGVCKAHLPTRWRALLCFDFSLRIEAMGSSCSSLLRKLKCCPALQLVSAAPAGLRLGAGPLSHVVSQYLEEMLFLHHDSGGPPARREGEGELDAANRLISHSKIIAQESRRRCGFVLCTTRRRAHDLAKRDESQGGQLGGCEGDTQCSPQPPTCLFISQVSKKYPVQRRKP